MYNTNRAFRVYELPPSFRFPPLREGNREGRAYSVPPACRGNHSVLTLRFGVAHRAVELLQLLQMHPAESAAHALD